jgi:hypothetical protein
MKASKDSPVAQYHLGGQMFAGDDVYYEAGWYVLNGEEAIPLIFADDSETQSRVLSTWET